MIGKKNRYFYAVVINYPENDPNFTPEEKKQADINCYYNSVLKFDMQEEKMVKQTSFGPTHNGGECFYQQRDGSNPDVNGEDDGYLMTAVHDWKTNTSQLMMWDAKTMECTMKADLKQNVPHGYHSYFVHEDDM